MTDRKACTKDNPSDGESYRWYHPDAVTVEEYYDKSDHHDDYERMKCPHCGLVFEVTIPN